MPALIQLFLVGEIRPWYVVFVNWTGLPASLLDGRRDIAGAGLLFSQLGHRRRPRRFGDECKVWSVDAVRAWTGGCYRTGGMDGARGKWRKIRGRMPLYEAGYAAVRGSKPGKDRMVFLTPPPQRPSISICNSVPSYQISTTSLSCMSACPLSALCRGGWLATAVERQLEMPIVLPHG